MYAFPYITLPEKAIAAAAEAGQPGDVFYEFNQLEATRICIISGPGFGQQPGTLHFRYVVHFGFIFSHVNVKDHHLATEGHDQFDDVQAEGVPNEIIGRI